MSTYAWLAIVLVLLGCWYLWNKYGAMYLAIKNNPNAVHAGLAVNRYVTDIEGLVGAFEGADNSGGDFVSRLGSFFGALPS